VRFIGEKFREGKGVKTFNYFFLFYRFFFYYGVSMGIRSG
jgi:hypothetical protein